MQPITFQTLKSAQDHSVNFVHSNGQESRYVRRQEDKLTIYLSSHNGCNMACRFCHLTQTGQTDMVPASSFDMIHQLQTGLDHYRNTLSGGGVQARRLNLNWMARGEPLENALLRDQAFERIYDTLYTQVLEQQFSELKEVRFNISTILPRTDLDSVLPRVRYLHNGTQVNLYYSLYSLDPQFRRRWLPKAMKPQHALGLLAEWQNANHNHNVILHWAFIEGENDDDKTVDDIIQEVRRSGLRARLNVVRYNPYSEAQGREPSLDVIMRHFNRISEAMKVSGSRIVPRVGFDVKASCGMFLEPDDEGF